jgi:glutamate dehydrogenase
MAHTKQTIASDLADDELLADSAFQVLLREYFPSQLRDRYRKDIERHSLRNELIAAVCANRLVDRGGESIAYRMRNETGASMADVVRAQEAAWRLFAMDDAWHAIESARTTVRPAARTELRLEGRRLVERSTRWLLRHEGRPLALDPLIARLSPGITALRGRWNALLSPGALSRFDATVAHYGGEGVPDSLATMAAHHRSLTAALDILDVAACTQRSPEDAATVFFALDEALGIGAVVAHIDALPRNDEWQSLARIALRDDVASIQNELAQRALQLGGADALLVHASPPLARWQSVSRRLPPENAPLDQLSVTVRELRTLLTSM